MTAITCPDGDECEGMQAWSVIEEPNGDIRWHWACDRLGSNRVWYESLGPALDAMRAAHIGSSLEQQA